MAHDFELHPIFHGDFSDEDEEQSISDKHRALTCLQEIKYLHDSAIQQKKDLYLGISHACLLWATEPQIKDYNSFVDLWESVEVKALLNFFVASEDAVWHRGIFQALDALYKLEHESLKS